MRIPVSRCFPKRYYLYSGKVSYLRDSGRSQRERAESMNLLPSVATRVTGGRTWLLDGEIEAYSINDDVLRVRLSHRSGRLT